MSGSEKLWGRCRHRDLVDETECLLCKLDKERGEKEDEDTVLMEVMTGEKRKPEVLRENREEGSKGTPKEKKEAVKYIRKTFISCFERAKKHWDQREDIS